MDRWSGILKVPLNHHASTAQYRVAASLCLSSASRSLTVPTANAIFFNGDRVEGTGNPVIEKLSDLQSLAEILVSKFGGSINAFVIEASTFTGPFAVYRDFIPSVNSWGEPKSYDATGFPASSSLVTLLSSCLKEAKRSLPKRQEPYQAGASPSSLSQPKTFIIGFSKGGTVLNQLVAELGFSSDKSSESPSDVNKQQMEENLVSSVEENPIILIPSSRESFLNSITEIHYVDVGLNSPGAYLTDSEVIERVSKRVVQGASGIRFILHGTPRQWCDSRRAWIKNEKDKLLHLLKSETQKTGGKLNVCERLYYADKAPSIQMHFEILEDLDVS